MGQSSSHDNCCVARSAGDEHPSRGRERREEDHQRPRNNDSYCASGGCLGTPTAESARRDNGACSVSCVNDRANGADQDKAPPLFGDKSLQPKLLRLQKLANEVDMLAKVSAQVAQRAAAGTVPLAPEAINDSTIEPLSVSQWAPVILLHDATVKGVPVALAVEACANVLGKTGRLIGKEEVVMRYSEIIFWVAEMARTRSVSLQTDLNALQDEVADIEDLIILCFEKIDEQGDDYITKNRFAAFLCGADGTNGARVVNPKDAERLFDFMTKDEVELTETGEKKLTFERFKDEITQGCLHVLDRNIDLNKKLLKKYRDCAM